MHRKYMVYMSLSYFVWLVPSLPCCLHCLSIHLLEHPQIRTVIVCLVSHPSIKNILSPPIGSQKNTWEHEQRNKGSEFFTEVFFSPLCKTSVYWKRSWQLWGPLSCVEGPWRAQLHCRKAPLLLVAVLFWNIQLQTHLCLFLSLLITETSFLWSTILHWPQLHCSLNDFSFIFNTISCVY